MQQYNIQHGGGGAYMMRPWKFWYGEPLEVMSEWIVSPAGC